MADQIRVALVEGPQKTEIPDDQRQRERMESGLPFDERQFELWERHGDIDRKTLEACGCDLEGLDDLDILSGCVVLVNNTVIKAYVNPLETGDLPYDVYVWEQAENRPFGYGVPYILRQASQRILNAAVRQMMDNGGLSSGRGCFRVIFRYQPTECRLRWRNRV